jgi:hypothetical protein
MLSSLIEKQPAPVIITGFNYLRNSGIGANIKRFSIWMPRLARKLAWTGGLSLTSTAKLKLPECRRVKQIARQFLPIKIEKVAWQL